MTLNEAWQPLSAGDKKSTPLDDYIWISLNKLSIPLDGLCEVFLDHYWLINADRQVAFYSPRGRSGRRPRQGAPQCNQNSKIAQILLERHKWATQVVRVPIAFLPHRCEDYL